MSELIPPFQLREFLTAPWVGDAGASNFWIVLMGFLVTASCGLVGNYLIWRRMALIGDAISHSILPGIAVAFLIANTRGSMVMFAGALVAGVVTTVLIEIIHKKTRVKQDSAIGIAFTTLFAIGVVLISVFASKVDLDQECVLYGELAFVSFEPKMEIAGMELGPISVMRMAGVSVITVLLIGLFYKELLVSSFDPGLALSIGINATVVHYALMGWLSVVVVSAFESVGAILVIAMLILPGATASLLSDKLPLIMMLTVVNAALSALIGLHLATWLSCSTAGAMVVAGTLLFNLVWIFSPKEGLIRRFLRPQLDALEPEAPQSISNVR
jgi:manganese/zinc/iron transport system permease protein